MSCREAFFVFLIPESGFSCGETEEKEPLHRSGLLAFCLFIFSLCGFAFSEKRLWVGSSKEGGRVGAFVSEFLCLAFFCISVTFFFEKTLFGFEFGVVSLLSGLDIPVRFPFVSQSTCGGCCCCCSVFVYDFPFRGREEVGLL